MAENLVLVLFVLAPVVLLAVSVAFFRRILPKLERRRGLALVAGNALILLILVALLVLSGEIYFRFSYDETDSFALCKTTERWFDRHFQYNTAGYRDTIDYGRFIEPDKRRVSFLGDSFTAGHGIVDVEDRFANRVRALRPDLDVHVLANCGWDTRTELEVIAYLPQRGYEMDLVVLVYCLNDIAEAMPEWQAILDRIYDAPEPVFLVDNSYFLNTLHARYRAASEPQIADYYDFVQTGYAGKNWDDQQTLLKSIRDVVHDADARLIVVTFPFLHALDGSYGFQPAHDVLAEFWSEQDVPHLDLLDVFAEYKAEDLVLSTRDAHPNELAHELAADQIAAFIDANL